MSDKLNQNAPPGLLPNFNQMTANAYPPHNTQGKSRTGHGKAFTLTTAGMSLGPQSAFNMHGLKASLPVNPNITDLGNNARPMQNNPFMIMPSGQALPVSAMYAQHGPNTDPGMPYLPPGFMPNYMNNANYGQCAWPYGLPAASVELDSARPNAWTAGDGMPAYEGGNSAMQPDFYPTCQFTHPATTASQHYVAGPWQPLKTKDNKGYQVVNLEAIINEQPPIPRAVPALWTNQEDLTLAKCLQNPEGITNIYIRGFMPDTTDEDLHGWAARFGEIESCKAIIDQDTGKCKGFGFVMYYSPAAAENCIRGFFHLGFQASYAQRSRNSRLKDLEDRASTNIYCTGVPIEWNESDLARHFEPYTAISTKICRDSPSGVSKEVGFARFETREVAEIVIREFHNIQVDRNSTRLYLRFADTKAQKQLKQQSQQRRQWRSQEYNYSVEHTPSPLAGRLQHAHISPNDSYESPAGVGNNFTPATSVSPPEAANVSKMMNNASASSNRSSAWPTSGNLQSITNTSERTPVYVDLPPHVALDQKLGNVPVNTPKIDVKATTPSPKKSEVAIKVESVTGKENVSVTPPTTK